MKMKRYRIAYMERNDKIAMSVWNCIAQHM